MLGWFVHPRNEEGGVRASFPLPLLPSPPVSRHTLLCPTIAAVPPLVSPLSLRQRVGKGGGVTLS